ncbi:hydroxyacylglutathione hydrolase [Parahaliea mediterranea]|uniref:Hydroxyacylglutathione hydrolase n=1 Tax=Parahaliea mediterranea TaxID=651086 RepID=A0A939IN35_9GAMM|nr:hydroxyacylglutathione hydrolase [Parahaliea mediterranea]MBN7797688.1 hydroxyacylglutathione hydrolase [Parahaliea mediterranea]
MLSISPIPAFNDNYIWLLQDAGRAVVVDPGDAGPVLAALRQQGLTLAGIMITHHHFDHVGGIADLLAAADVPVWGPRNPAIEAITHRLGAGDRVDILGREFHVLEVPGHTLDHIAYFHDAEPPLLFCGDTLFAGGCGRLFEGSPEVMLDSLKSLAALPPATRVYCAHEYTLANLAFARAAEPDNQALAERQRQAVALRDRDQPTVPSTLAEELETNPFLRCETAALRAALRAQGRLEGDSGAAVFATVRAWKDNF